MDAQKLIIYLTTEGFMTQELERCLIRYFDAQAKTKKTFKPLGLDSKMPFGKFKGSLISEIKEKDPNYFNWIKNNIENINF